MQSYIEVTQLCGRKLTLQLQGLGPAPGHAPSLLSCEWVPASAGVKVAAEINWLVSLSSFVRDQLWLLMSVCIDLPIYNIDLSLNYIYQSISLSINFLFDYYLIIHFLQTSLLRRRRRRKKHTRNINFSCITWGDRNVNKRVLFICLFACIWIISLVWSYCL